MSHAAVGHAAIGHEGMAHDAASTVSPQHVSTEYGPTVDGRAEQVSTRIDDPGVGLRDKGRRVPTYADLHTVGGPTYDLLGQRWYLRASWDL